MGAPWAAQAAKHSTRITVRQLPPSVGHRRLLAWTCQSRTSVRLSEHTHAIASRTTLVMRTTVSRAQVQRCAGCVVHGSVVFAFSFLLVSGAKASRSELACRVIHRFRTAR